MATAHPPTEALVLAIDAGTTGVTALLVNRTATVVARGYREFPQHFPDDGWVEHDLAQIWTAVLGAVQDIAAGREADIVAVGLTNQRETLAIWDRETLGAARPAIVWQDRRTATICQKLRDAGHEARVRELTGLRLDPYFTATQAMWVRDNEPHVWSGIDSGRLALGTIDSYLVARMSRGVDHITDATNASRTLLYDLHTGQWSAELCELFGIPISALPDVVASYGQLSRTDPRAFAGIDAPITGIAGDQQAALVGQACFTAGSAKCTYGTGSFLLMHTGDRRVMSSGGLLTTVALAHPDGQRDFALEGAVFVTGAAIQWLRDGLGIISGPEEVEALAASVVDTGGVVFVPALTGLGAPAWDPSARGMIIGITRGTTRAHVARATLEAIAYQVRDVAELMITDAGMPIDQLAIDGGAAINNLLCQMQADALQAQVNRSAELQTTSLGAAFLAGLGAGLWESTSELTSTRASSGVFTPATMDTHALQRWHEAVQRSLHWSDR